jgi:aspartyl-tRNA(Asn)/glutamyl-tRNA(Gln) amidotransferase subunit A
MATIKDLSQHIARKDLSPVEITEAILARIDATDTSLGSYITVLAESALRSAHAAEQEIQQGRYRGPLHGVPIAVKDLVWTKGVVTTCASSILKDYIPSEDATIIKRFRDSGAVLLGKLNMHEFAFGVTGETSAFGPCRNPWDLNRLPGGSSSGSGVAVAAGLAYGAIGTDTGGSIRIPASLCGTVGLKATYGRVSRYGVIPLSWSFDHVGPLARSVEDAALLLNSIAGHDQLDPSSAEVSVPEFDKGLSDNLRGVRLGIPREFFFENITAEVKSAVTSAIDRMSDLGAQIQEVSIPLLDHTVAIWNTCVLPEATAYHLNHLRTHPELYTPEVRERLELGLFIPAVAYATAQRIRRKLSEQVYEVFRNVDIIIGPTTPSSAPKAGGEEVLVGETKQDARISMGYLTRVANLTGIPSISLPCGFSSHGMPIGMQLMAKSFDESTAIRTAHAYEKATTWHEHHPELSDTTRD